MSYTRIDNINLAGEKIVIRLDLNVPMRDARVQDIKRIERIIPTLKMILSKKPRYVLILSHLGRPKSISLENKNHDESLRPVAPILEKLLGNPVIFTTTPIGISLLEELNTLPINSVVMAENIRFYEGEEKNSQDFSKTLGQLGSIFINDAFSCSHRAHASVVGITKYLPSYAGPSLDSELRALEQVLISPKRPVLGVIAGSKVSTKIDLLFNLMDKLDYLFVGGGIANTLLYALGHNVGKSLIEKDCLDIAMSILKKANKSQCKLELPVDAVTAKELYANAPHQTADIEMISDSDAIYDIGPKTIEKLKRLLHSSKTLLWNGPLGVYEVPPFGKGSALFVTIVKEQTKEKKLISIIGGGDTIAAIHERVESFTYVSTAGGAFLEWLEGKILPGIVALELQQN